MPTSDRTSLEPAFVLHARPYRNTSLLLEAFTRSGGRVGLVARGARGGRRPRSALLQPFVPLLVSWSGRGELRTLGRVEAAGGPHGLPPAALASGLYLNELLVRLLHRDDPHPALFDAYAGALGRLAEDIPQEPILRRFECVLLAETGYALNLDHESGSGRPLDPDRRYCYDPERGPLERGGECDGVTVHGRTLLALARGELEDPEVLAEAKRLMRHVIGRQLGGRPLHSRKLYRPHRV